MIGRHEAALILACRRAQRAGAVVTENQARGIAALWQSPNRRDQAITAFASSGRRLPSLRSEVEREIRESSPPRMDAVSRLELRSLLAWIIANPIDVVRYEHVLFYQGDSADDVLKMIYPEWEYASASIGWPDGAESALAEVKTWDNGKATDVPDGYERPDASYGSSMVEDDDHVLAWHFGLGWVSLSRKIKEIG